MSPFSTSIHWSASIQHHYAPFESRWLGLVGSGWFGLVGAYHLSYKPIITGFSTISRIEMRIVGARLRARVLGPNRSTLDQEQLTNQLTIDVDEEVAVSSARI